MTLIKDTNSPEWLAIKKYCETRLTELREENDQDHDIAETAKLRGMIEFTKEILSLEQSEETIQVNSESYID